MDTKLIKQFGTDILCYRIRTERQKKRMQYEDFDKHLIGLSKEESILYKKKYKPEWELLPTPYQRGWIRSFVLRDDVARGNKAAFFENILRKINTSQWSYRKDFKTKKRKFGRKVYVVKDQQLLKPHEWDFNKLGLTDAEKQFFYTEFHYDQRSGKFVKQYGFTEPWRFVLRVKPNMIYKKIKIDTYDASRLAEINNYICINNYRGRLQKAWYRHKRAYWQPHENVKDRYIFKNRSLQYILDASKEEIIFEKNEYLIC